MGDSATQPLSVSFGAARRAGDWTTRLRWPAIALLLCAGTVAFAVYLFRITSTVSVNSADLAGVLLSAEDMVHGNWLLHGWIIGSDSLWLTDGLVYAAAFAVRGLDPALLHVVPALMGTALVAVAAAAATAGRKGPVVAFAAVLAVLPVVFPSPIMVEVLTGPFHTDAIVVALVAAVALYHAQERFDRAPLRWALTGFAFGLLTAGTLSDPYTVVLALVPIALVSLLRALSVRGEERWRRALPLAVVVAAWYAGPAAVWWVRELGGATIIPFLPATVPYTQLGESVSNLTLALLQLAGGDVFGRVIDRSLVPVVLRLVYLAVAIAAVGLVLRDEGRGLAKNRSGGEWLTAVLALSAALALAGNVLGTADYNARYRLPVLVMSSVVLARQFAVLGSAWIARRAIFATVAALIAVSFYAGPWTRYVHPMVRRTADPYLVLGRSLEAHGLEYGFGGYDEASNVTVDTRGAVQVRPVVSTKVHQPGFGPSGIPPADWRLTRVMVSSKDAWYLSRPRRFFVVFDTASQWDRDTGVDPDLATKTYGPPHYVYRVDRFMVLVWE